MCVPLIQQHFYFMPQPIQSTEALLQALTEGQAHLSKEQQPAFSTFVSYFIERSYENAFWEYPLDRQRAALMAFFEWQQVRDNHTIRVRVSNPHSDLPGYACAKTVIEIAQQDCPYIIDSLQMVLNRLQLEADPIISLGGLLCTRDASGELRDVHAPDSDDNDLAHTEAPVRIEIQKIDDAQGLQQLENDIQRTLQELHQAFGDSGFIREKCQALIEELEAYKRQFPSDETREAITFLKWLLDEHFVFFGYRQYDLIDTSKEDAYIQASPDSGYGLLRSSDKASPKKRLISTMPEEAQRLMKSNKVLVVTKTNTKSRIHKPVYTDYIGIKRFNDEGKLIGEHRFIGLFSQATYHDSLKNIPFLRQKVSAVLALSKLPVQGHSGKKLVAIMEDLPRDDLFQISIDELYQTSMAILHLQERKVIRLFTRKDIYGRFYSCLVYLPKEKVTLHFTQKFEEILKHYFHSDDISSTIHYDESITARLHYVVRLAAEHRTDDTMDFSDLEANLIAACKSWSERLQEALKKSFLMEEAARLYTQYQHSFSVAYQEDFSIEDALYDISHLESLTDENPLAMSMFTRKTQDAQHLNLKLFQLHEAIPLSTIMPIFENMGLEVLEERPYECQLDAQRTVWICDYRLKSSSPVGTPFDLVALKPLLSDLFFALWSKQAENDRLNALVQLTANPWRMIVIIRAYVRYVKQTALPYDQTFVEGVLLKHYTITHLLLRLFVARFSIESQPADATIQFKTDILNLLNKVSNLDEDKILRTFLTLIEATLRTNFYQTLADGSHKSYVSFKLKSNKIPVLPLPYPLYEVFVYSPAFEAIHLRATKVARGGIRWSDRREDFRTEVLGLMKAQQVKNTVIVPGGSKGGFVLKTTAQLNREELQQEAIRCYQNFMRGLLDLTDNLQGNDILHPPQVKRFDEDDPYLVVAADKGTATFSDYANAVAQEYQFWLDDAFASGGSFGYDHKKIAITARGAWISVEAHFKTLGINPDTTEFTAVGIGDMAGDVFGNGMLRSRKTRLLAAFNHLHIFIDPNPDSEATYVERQRLFDLPRSSWADYNTTLISSGGGVFERCAKEINLTPEIKAWLGIEADSLEPNALIQAILLAPVDLLFNGGIGTYVKASDESHLDVGDKANDVLRVNGQQLRCRVVGEGGNLGFTQRGRVEFAQAGGLIFTDFIDNSAGVDLSDHEVNAKILLSQPMNAGTLQLDHRNALLKALTDEVASLVLADNRDQTELLNYANSQAVNELEIYGRCLLDLEKNGKINRKVEFLPSESMIQARLKQGVGLSLPEIAIVLAYVKMDLKLALLKSSILSESHFLPMLQREFPQRLTENYPQALAQHRLQHEITATQLVNQLMTETSILFVQRLQEEVNASVADIVKAYSVVREVFQLPAILAAVRELDYQVPIDVQHQVRRRITRFTRRATRWLLRHHLPQQSIEHTIQEWQLIRDMTLDLSHYLQGAPLQKFDSLMQEYTDYGLPPTTAKLLASIRSYDALLDINAIGLQLQQTGPIVATAYFSIGEKLGLGWLREEMTCQHVSNHWEGLAHSSQRDELDHLQAQLTHTLLSQIPQYHETDIHAWFDHQQAKLANWYSLYDKLQRAGKTNYIMYSVALKALSDVLAQLI